MSTNDPTLNMNLLLEQMETSIDLTEKNAQHFNDREVASCMAVAQRRYVDLMKGQMHPSESSIRILKDEEESKKEH